MATKMDELLDARVIFVIRGTSADEALTTAHRLATLGARALELTYTIPDALEALRALTGDQPETFVGMGTVIDESQARLALEAGARFLVSPGLDLPALRFARARDCPMLPGVQTPTEVMAALAAGAEAVKLFPARPAGPDLLRALRGPFPLTRFVPSGGVKTSDADQWFEAGATAVGVSADASRPSEVEVRSLLALAESRSQER